MARSLYISLPKTVKRDRAIKGFNKMLHVMGDRGARQDLKEFCRENNLDRRNLYIRIAQWPIGRYHEWFWDVVNALKAKADPNIDPKRLRYLNARAVWASRHARGIYKIGTPEIRAAALAARVIAAASAEKTRYSRIIE